MAIPTSISKNVLIPNVELWLTNPTRMATAPGNTKRSHKKLRRRINLSCAISNLIRSVLLLTS
jgi:hypothetical protein